MTPPDKTPAEATDKTAVDDHDLDQVVGGTKKSPPPPPPPPPPSGGIEGIAGESTTVDHKDWE